MTRVIETSDLATYLDVEVQPKWEHIMKNEIDSLSKNQT
jgi:hypothetical protein